MRGEQGQWERNGYANSEELMKCLPDLTEYLARDTLFPVGSVGCAGLVARDESRLREAIALRDVVSPELFVTATLVYLRGRD